MHGDSESSRQGVRESLQEAGDEWRVFPYVRALTQTRCDRGSRVQSGAPYTIIVCDPESAPAAANSARLRIFATQRTKPTKGKGSGAFGGTGS